MEQLRWHCLLYSQAGQQGTLWATEWERNGLWIFRAANVGAEEVMMMRSEISNILKVVWTWPKVLQTDGNFPASMPAAPFPVTDVACRLLNAFGTNGVHCILQTGNAKARIRAMQLQANGLAFWYSSSNVERISAFMWFTVPLKTFRVC